MTGPVENPPEDIAALDARAREQRQRLADRLALVRDRLRPANLAHEAGNRALDLGLDSFEKARKLARAHPGKAVAAAIAAGAVLGRRPLIGLLKTGWTKFRNRKASAGESED